MDNWTLKPAADHELPLAERARSVRREPGLVEAAAHWAWTSAAWVYLRIAHRITVAGCEHLPIDAPFVLACNHCSHLDAPALAGALPWRLRAEAFPVAAGDTFFTTPAASLFAAAAVNALPVSRDRAGRHALANLRARLVDGGCGLILFPEGTRSRTGEMRPFKAGMGMLVAGTNVPVVPCRLSGTFAALPPGARRPRLARVGLKIGSPLLFADASNDRAGWDRVASDTEAAVRGL